METQNIGVWFSRQATWLASCLSSFQSNLLPGRSGTRMISTLGKKKSTPFFHNSSALPYQDRSYCPCLFFPPGCFLSDFQGGQIGKFIQDDHTAPPHPLSPLLFLRPEHTPHLLHPSDTTDAWFLLAADRQGGREVGGLNGRGNDPTN